MNRKTVFAVLFILLAALVFCAEEKKTIEGLDLVLMIDTSSGMAGYFDDLTKFVFSKILSESLRRGDTFHLLSFSDRPSFILEEKFEADLSVTAIAESFLFLRQKLLFGRYTDILAGIEYLVHYAEGLPRERKKLLILLTDGINDPPPESPFYGLSQKDASGRLRKLALKTIEKYSWSVRIILFPGDEDKRGMATEPPAGTREGDKASKTTEAKKDEFTSFIEDTLAATLVPYDRKDEKDELLGKITGFPMLIFPDDLGDQGRRIRVPFKIRNYLSEPLEVTLVSMAANGTNILREPSVSGSIPADSISPFDVEIILPEEIPIGKTTLPVTLAFSENLHISPLSGNLVFNYKGDIIGDLLENPANYIFFIIIIFIAALVALAVFLIIRMKVFENIFMDVLGPSGTKPKREHGTEFRGDLIEMRVAFQNPHIGFRNIHRLHEDKRLLVGGGLSTFLIFLIPIPSGIAEIAKENDKYVFYPLKSDFFPEQKEPLYDCINKDIQIISKHGYRSAIRFHKYTSPLSELNHLLHSVNHVS